MDYAQKYKEALERAMKLRKDAIDMGENLRAKQCEIIFPELKGSGDEIPQKLHNLLCAEVTYEQFEKHNLTVDSALHWLEKQGEILESIKHKEAMLDCQTCANYKNECFPDRNIFKCSYPIKHSGKNPQDVDEKQDEQKPADKVEPKFKVGDFIVNDYCMGRVVELTNDAYLLDTEQGIPFSCEHNVHLWSINDAKDGDVLMSRAPFIYGKQRPYGGLDWYNGKFIKASNYVFKDSPVHPATKEQCNLLFAKMKEEGFKWDAEKKELKKISQEYPLTPDECVNPTWSEEDEIIIGNIRHIISEYDKITKKANEPCWYIGDCLLWLQDIELKGLPQSKQEWSEEDEKTLDKLITNYESGYLPPVAERCEYIIWLKSLKLHPRLELSAEDLEWFEKQGKRKSTWSKEDERILEQIKFAVLNLPSYREDTRQECIDWLKLLKERIGG